MMQTLNSTLNLPLKNVLRESRPAAQNRARAEAGLINDLPLGVLPFVI